MFDHLDETTRELLGVGRDDPWLYAAIAFLLGGAYANGLAASAAFAVATALFVKFLTISTPRYLSDADLGRTARVIGLVGNAGFFVLFATVVVLKLRGLVP